MLVNRTGESTESDQINEIKFFASVSSVKTLADNGIRVTLDLPENAIKEAAMLMEYKREMIYLSVAVRAENFHT